MTRSFRPLDQMKMDWRRIILVIGALLLSFTSITFGTPGFNRWERALLLGANDDSYYTLVFTRHNPGSYYSDFDTVYVQQRSNQSGEIVRRFEASTQVLRDTTAYGDWAYLSDSAYLFDSIEFVRAERVRLAFPYTQNEIHVADRVAFVGRDSLGVPLLSEEELCAPFGGIESFTKSKKDGPVLLTVYQCGPTWRDSDYIYLLLQDSPNWYNEGISVQRVIPVPYESYRNALTKYYDDLRRAQSTK
jgi:hypothetical protein